LAELAAEFKRKLLSPGSRKSAKKEIESPINKKGSNA
jgi:hypothetical protein